MEVFDSSDTLARTAAAQISVSELNGHSSYGAERRPAANRIGIVLGTLAVICISVVLSVVTTIFVLSVAESGVLLPQYLQYNQPSKASQLGFCVSQHKGHIHIWQAVNGAGYCYQGTYVHVQPKVVQP